MKAGFGREAATMGDREYRFTISAYTPDTLPMERLADYMADLAKILGEPNSVHFVRLELGSITLVQKIDEEAEPKVRARAHAGRAGDGPPEAVAAYRRLNRRLLEDDAAGVLADDRGAKVIDFPGCKQAEPITFGAFNQEGSVDGVVIRVGGVRDLVPVTLMAADEKHTRCLATRETAQALAHYLFGPEIRVYGSGRWFRDRAGFWNLERFTVGRFEILGDEPLSAVLARLRDIPGSEWHTADDPWDELRGERDGTDEMH